MNSIQPGLSRRRGRGAGRAFAFLMIMMAVILGSILLLPLALLYFIDPSVASAYLTYGAPYMVIPIVVVFAVLGLVFGIQVAVRRRSPRAGPEFQPAQLVPVQPLEGQEAWSHPTPVIEREIIHEVVKVRCQFCGTLNLETATKCESCGANL